MQPANKIAISQSDYDDIIRNKNSIRLDWLGVHPRDVRIRVGYHLGHGAKQDDAWKMGVDDLVTVDPSLSHPDIETDAQFIEDWAQWAETENGVHKVCAYCHAVFVGISFVHIDDHYHPVCFYKAGHEMGKRFN